MAYWIKIDNVNRAPRFEFEDKPEDKLRFGLSLGLPIGPRRLPVRAREETKRKNYPDLFSMPGLNAVGPRFKALVEEFEPGVHQFFPLELFYKNGQRVEDTHYIFNCAVSFDSLLVNQSDITWLKLDEPEECPRVNVRFRHKNVLSRPAIGGRHIWCSFRVGRGGIFVSDEFYEQMRRRKIKYFWESPCEEADIPWAAEENIKPILEWEAKHGFEPGMKPWLLEHPDILY